MQVKLWSSWAGLLGGSGVVIGGVISPLIWVISIVTLLITLLITTLNPKPLITLLIITTHEPPSKVSRYRLPTAEISITLSSLSKISSQTSDHMRVSENRGP